MCARLFVVRLLDLNACVLIVLFPVFFFVLVSVVVFVLTLVLVLILQIRLSICFLLRPPFCESSIVYGLYFD